MRKYNLVDEKSKVFLMHIVWGVGTEMRIGPHPSPVRDAILAKE
jgi:hypothetical protein